MSIIKIILIVVLLSLGALTYYLFRPLANIPGPAAFNCLDIEDGQFIPKDSLPLPTNIYGMGLTYRNHLLETAAEFDPAASPPIFKKDIQSLDITDAKVKLPAKAQLTTAAASLEPAVADQLNAEFEEINPMLDYEVELGFVLLEPITAAQLADDSFIPPLGFFVANDLSARSLALLGEGSSQRYAYWGISKSFPGFLPMTDQIWVPDEPGRNAIPCLQIETYVNGEVRQSQGTDNMIYTPLEMLRFIQEKYPDQPLQKGDLVLTGTPGGVAIATPRALVRLSNLLGFDRFKKLSIKLGGDLSPFLKTGDQVEVRGGELGRVLVEIE
jgi:2-keto-4-pentenoate hydratase/2-oxohepta-3-ene-1,7-dioic acid hydratase in catechol pathway